METTENRGRRVDDNVHAERITQIEQGHVALQKDVRQLTGGVASLTTAVESIAKNVDRLASAQSLQQRTNWGNLAAWATVIIVVLGLVIYEPMRQLAGSFAVHVVDGHPRTVIERMNLVGGEIRDDVLEIQGEIDELNDEVDEVANSDARHDERILDIERRLADITGSEVKYRSGRPE